MKKFFGLFFFFVLFGVLFDLIKYGADSGVYNEWFFVFAVLLMLIMCWLGVFFGVKYLQHNESQRNKELEKKSKFIRVYILVIQVWSVMATFDIMDYFAARRVISLSSGRKRAAVSTALPTPCTRSNPMPEANHETAICHPPTNRYTGEHNRPNSIPYTAATMIHRG